MSELILVKCKCKTTRPPEITEQESGVAVIRCPCCDLEVKTSHMEASMYAWNKLMQPVQELYPQERCFEPNKCEGIQRCSCGKYPKMLSLDDGTFCVRCLSCGNTSMHFETKELAIMQWTTMMNNKDSKPESFNCTRCTCGRQPTVLQHDDKRWNISCDKRDGGCGNHTMKYERRSDAVANWNENIGKTATSCIKSRTDLVNKMTAEVKLPIDDDCRRTMDAFVRSQAFDKARRSCRFIGVSMNLGTVEKPVEVTTANVDDVCKTLQAMANLIRKL